MVNVFERKLGKRAPRIDKRTLRFLDYLKAPNVPPLPYPPKEVNWLDRVNAWPMYGNDQLGDCVEACAGHMIQVWNSFRSPVPPSPTEEQIVQAYSAITGYVPGDPTTDQGTFILDLLKYWRNTGIAGHKILAFVALTPGDLIELRQAVELFGAPMIGLALPNTAQEQNAWTVVDVNQNDDGAPGSWGGHCVPPGAFDYIPSGEIRNTVITWGAEMQMSNNFYKAYNDESYAVLSQDWIDANGLSPSQFDLAQLQADLSRL